MGKHYVDNKQLYQTLLDYKFLRQEAEKKGLGKKDKGYPPIPNYVGECLLQIANRLSYKPNFSNYMFREEMVGDGIENCINYLNNFDPEKSKNPFAYFTQIIYYAFLRRIDREKRQLYIKHKTLENHMIMDDMATHADDASETGSVKVNLETDYMKDFVSNFEDKIEKRKERREEKKKTENLDKFIDE